MSKVPTSLTTEKKKIDTFDSVKIKDVYLMWKKHALEWEKRSEETPQ